MTRPIYWGYTGHLYQSSYNGILASRSGENLHEDNPDLNRKLESLTRAVRALFEKCGFGALKHEYVLSTTLDEAGKPIPCITYEAPTAEIAEKVSIMLISAGVPVSLYPTATDDNLRAEADDFFKSRHNQTEIVINIRRIMEISYEHGLQTILDNPARAADAAERILTEAEGKPNTRDEPDQATKNWNKLAAEMEASRMASPEVRQELEAFNQRLDRLFGAGQRTTGQRSA